MKNQSVKELDNMKMIAQRFQLITVARYRDKTKIKKAMATQDQIREKTKGGKNLTEEIRKWRDSRYGPSRS